MTDILRRLLTEFEKIAIVESVMMEPANEFFGTRIKIKGITKNIYPKVPLSLIFQMENQTSTPEKET